MHRLVERSIALSRAQHGPFRYRIADATATVAAQYQLDIHAERSQSPRNYAGSGGCQKPAA